MFFRIVSLLVPLFCLTTPALGQWQDPCSKPGVLIAESRDAGPIGKLRARSYRLEKQDDKTFCLRVKTDSNATSLIWINDNAMPAYERKYDEVTAQFPLNWLEQGATISVSSLQARYDLISFKQRLKLPESIIRLQQASPAESIRISAIRRVYRYAGMKPAPFVEIEITKPSGFYPVVANNTWMLQIGKTGFAAGVDPNQTNQLTAIMNEQTFAKLKNGDRVRVSFGGFPAKSFAKLDKSIFQRAITQGTILRDVPQPADKNPRYLFYLPGYMAASANVRYVNPGLGAYDDSMILHALQDRGFVVIGEGADKSPDTETYAQRLAAQIRQMLNDGVPAKRITVVGASQGSWVAMLVSTYLKNRGVNFVLIGACSADKDFLKMVDLHGNVLSIYERSDDVAQSCRDYKDDATGVNDWKEIEVNTGLKHRFLLRPMKEWFEPMVAWAKR